MKELIEKLQSLPEECNGRDVLINVCGEWGRVDDVKLPNYRDSDGGDEEYCLHEDPIVIGYKNDSYIWMIASNF